jgi:uncharacterized protein (TIGR03067 family)
MNRCGPLSLAVGLVLGEEAPDGEAKKELKRLQGTWVAVKVEEGGKALPAAKIKGWSLTVVGNKYAFRPGRASVEGVYRLSPGDRPKRVDATRTNGPDKGKVLEGIYELDSDELKMCFSSPGGKRPTAFSTGDGGGQRFYFFKRARPSAEGP